MNWFAYPPEFRIKYEVDDNSVQNIIIGSDTESSKFKNWDGTFVIDPNGEAKLINFMFKWKHSVSNVDIDESKLYPKVSPKFDFGKYQEKVRNLLDDKDKLKNWDENKTIKQNLKQVYLLFS